MKTVVLSIDPTFGNSFGIAEAIGAIPCFRQKDPKGIWKGKTAYYGYENIPKADLYVIVSGQCFYEIRDKIIEWRSKQIPVKVILTDRFYREHSEILNAMFNAMDIEVFCMPDLYHLTDNAQLFYQPFRFNIEIQKSQKFTICHSPYSESKSLEKNTKLIKGIIDSIKLDFNFDLIMRLPWNEALVRKSKSHITIDQLREGDYIGGVGKSGLEAMLLQSVVFSSGKPVSKNIPAPPVIWCNKNTLKNRLIHCIEHHTEWEYWIEEQRKWALKYLSYEFCKKNLI